jgi:DUF4097 and DUF4098 domain-containing protein YvlB
LQKKRTKARTKRAENREAAMHRTLETALLATITLVAGCAESYEDETFELEGPIDEVVVSVDTGDIDLRVGREERGRVVVEMDCRTEAPPVDVTLDGTTLRVNMDAGNGASACTASFEITVPRQADAELRTGGGDVAIDGLEGDVTVATYRGDVRAGSLTGALDLTAVAGRITAWDLESTEALLTIGAGDLEAAFTGIPRAVDAVVTVGDVTLDVPRAAYRVEAASETGEVGVEGVDERRSADNEILVEVTSGDILVLGSPLAVPASSDAS